MRAKFWRVASALVAFALTGPARAGSTDFFFSTGNPDGLMATASRPSSAGKIEIESADDFVLTSPTSLTSATFTGLIPTGLPLSGISDVRIEIYRVFPNESDVGRTSGPPTFSTPQVPTRVNSPSDVELDDRSASANTLKFTPGIIQQTFTANNSVLNGIHPIPGFHTGGDGSVTGQEVQFNVLFTKPFNLPADHYFFVPQVQLTSGDFFWLSAPRPIVPPGTSFPPGSTDLQEWIRNENLAPDWLRVGADIVGGTTFNATFTLSGDVVPEPSSVFLLFLGGIGVLGAMRVKKRQTRA
ncbi:MAG: PEP-CTERM sorting domain-containing protein [Isosphaeraceae bacterium]